MTMFIMGGYNMDYNNISNEKLSKMVEDILNGKEVESDIPYVDERANEFIKSLQNMVEDKESALKNYRNLM